MKENRLQLNKDKIQFKKTGKENRLQLNKDKIQFKKTEVSFFQHQWSKDGLSPDPEKTDSISLAQYPNLHTRLILIHSLFIL